MTFDENLQAGIGNFFISDSSGVRTISVTDSQVSISGKTVTINPMLDLDAATNYKITMSGDVLKDMSGNAFVGLSGINVISFTTVDSVTSGKAIDGYLKGATVFADTNGNGVWDKGEAKTITDDNGDFKLTNARGAIVASGGIDLTSNLPFNGILKAPAGSTVVTPLTTVQQGFVESGFSVKDAQIATATAFGFDSTKVDLKTYDPIAVLKSANSTDQKSATDLMASATKIANFLATVGQVLTGAADKDAKTGQENLSLKNANNALLKSLVSAIKDDAKTGDGKIDLADSTLLKSVLVGSSKQSDTDKVNFTVAKATEYQIRVAKMADSVTEILKNSANSITDTVSKGGDATALLTNMGKVASFTQNDVGGILKETARTLDVQSTTVANDLKGLATTLNTLQNSTGNFEDKSAAMKAELKAFMDHKNDVVVPTPTPVIPTPTQENNYSPPTPTPTPTQENNYSPPPPPVPPISLNQGSVLIDSIELSASGGDKKYAIETVKENNVLPTANVKITGFGAGDKLIFHVAQPAQGFTTVDAIYTVFDNGSDVQIYANDGGNIQLIALVGMTDNRSSVGNAIDTITELNTFLGNNAVNFI